MVLINLQNLNMKKKKKFGVAMHDNLIQQT
jgi:hypothetical protein